MVSCSMISLLWIWFLCYCQDMKWYRDSTDPWSHEVLSPSHAWELSHIQPTPTQPHELNAVKLDLAFSPPAECPGSVGDHYVCDNLAVYIWTKHNWEHETKIMLTPSQYWPSSKVPSQVPTLTAHSVPSLIGRDMSTLGCYWCFRLVLGNVQLLMQ